MESKGRELITTNIYIPFLLNIILLLIFGAVYLWNYMEYPSVSLLTRNAKDIVKAASSK